MVSKNNIDNQKEMDKSVYAPVMQSKDTIDFDTIYEIDDWNDDLFEPASPKDVAENDLGKLLFEDAEVSKMGAMRKLENELFEDGDPWPNDLAEVVLEDAKGYQMDDIGSVLFSPMSKEEKKKKMAKGKSIGNVDAIADPDDMMPSMGDKTSKPMSSTPKAIIPLKTATESKGKSSIGDFPSVPSAPPSISTIAPIGDLPSVPSAPPSISAIAPIKIPTPSMPSYGGKGKGKMMRGIPRLPG